MNKQPTFWKTNIQYSNLNQCHDSASSSTFLPGHVVASFALSLNKDGTLVIWINMKLQQNRFNVYYHRNYCYLVTLFGYIADVVSPGIELSNIS